MNFEIKAMNYFSPMYINMWLVYIRRTIGNRYTIVYDRKLRQLS